MRIDCSNEVLGYVHCSIHYNTMKRQNFDMTANMAGGDASTMKSDSSGGGVSDTDASDHNADRFNDQSLNREYVILDAPSKDEVEIKYQDPNENTEGDRLDHQNDKIQYVSKKELQDEIGKVREEIGQMRKVQEELNKTVAGMGKILDSLVKRFDEVTAKRNGPDLLLSTSDQISTPNFSQSMVGSLPNVGFVEGTAVGEVGRQQERTRPSPSSSNNGEDGSGSSTNSSRTTKRSFQDYDDADTQGPPKH